jgi:hypothetical protein
MLEALETLETTALSELAAVTDADALEAWRLAGYNPGVLWISFFFAVENISFNRIICVIARDTVSDRSIDRGIVARHINLCIFVIENAHLLKRSFQTF